MSNPNDQSLTDLANAAFEQAAKKVIQRAIQTGTPVILWENDEIKNVAPQTMTPSKTNLNSVFDVEALCDLRTSDPI
ncbi:hypothetical protein [Schlesneria paludicola]|uniref:hypothetical protein n=1 Tax=Schlesneria paludicola TaxID=360056 RepID=UPI00029ABCBF|nr:hypothetical protein [Schlesneria paludicola]